MPMLAANRESFSKRDSSRRRSWSKRRLLVGGSSAWVGGVRWRRVDNSTIVVRWRGTMVGLVREILRLGLVV